MASATKWSILVSEAAMLLLVLAPAAMARSRAGGQAAVACGDGMVVYSPITVWPPNHKLKTVTIQFIDQDSDADALSLTVNSIADNQSSTDASGSGGCGAPTATQGPDWTFSSTPVTGTDPTAVTTTVQVRAERCGSLPGPRVYDINVTCAESGSETTSTTVDLLVSVPHDQRK